MKRIAVIPSRTSLMVTGCLFGGLITGNQLLAGPARLQSSAVQEALPEAVHHSSLIPLLFVILALIIVAVVWQAVRARLKIGRKAEDTIQHQDRTEYGTPTKRVFDIDERMKQLMDAHPGIEIEEPRDLFNNLPWLTQLDEEVFQQLVVGFDIRHFPVEATLLKEQDTDNGMFVIVRGEVRIEMRGSILDVVGTGSLIGEMAVLTGYPRSASVIAVSPVTVLWMDSAILKSIMKRSKELENRLWEFASMRFAMNLLGNSQPFNKWEQEKFIEWLAVGEIKVPNENGWIDLEGKVGVLVTGTAALHDGSTIIKAPSTLEGCEYIFSKEARVFLRDK
jgi:hypothetical protein